MIYSLDNCLGSDPASYARKILKECHVKLPPTPQETILDYLKIEVREFPEDDGDLVSLNPELRKHLQDACACLSRYNGTRLIRIYKDQPYPRKKLGTFHECGHDVLPWHKDLNYICTPADLHAFSYNLYEKEAFKFGTELNMPTQSFFEQILRTVPSFSLMKHFGNMYESSTEATAIKYALCYPGRCGLAMLGPVDNDYHKTHSSGSSDQLGLGLNLKPLQIPFDLPSSPLRVKYFVKSHRFPKFIKPGTFVPTDSQTFELWNRRSDKKMEIQVSDFGSRDKYTFLAETRYVSQTNNLMMFLWLDDPQVKIELKSGEIYYESSPVR